MNKKTQQRIRLFMTYGILMAFGAVLIAVTAIGIESGRGGGLSVLALLIATPLLAHLISLVWRYSLVLIDEQEEGSESLEKRKRERLDSVLRALSDEDLLHLKKRLVDGSLNDDLLYEDMLGDDGELLVEES
jgi:hypothetical protein